jgi:hypothetical protein
MRKKLTAIVTFAAVTLIVAAAAGAHPVTAKQKVEIDVRGAGGHSFVLTPLGHGALKGDRGTVSFCCWSERNVTRNGEVVNVNNPEMTLVGARGTIVTRNEIGWIDVPDGWSLFTGSWRVVSGTGAYVGLSGGGLAAGVFNPVQRERTRYKGVVGTK